MTAKANARSAIFVSAALVIAMGAPASAQAQTCGPSQLQLNHDANLAADCHLIGREDRDGERPIGKHCRVYVAIQVRCCTTAGGCHLRPRRRGVSSILDRAGLHA